jgi:hypothetical protein
MLSLFYSLNTTFIFNDAPEPQFSLFIHLLLVIYFIILNFFNKSFLFSFNVSYDFKVLLNSRLMNNSVVDFISSYSDFKLFKICSIRNLSNSPKRPKHSNKALVLYGHNITSTLGSSVTCFTQRNTYYG